ncbi:MAG: zinc-binding dehydrogenase [Acidobacteriota bacterium]|nr:zinc-binding dehydrogenase [Acidobacteriota bacterium]
MAAVVHYALKQGAVELREAPRPASPAEDEVLLASRAIGVCGSDVHQFHNTQSWAVNVPVILGHEFCGVIREVGKGVKNFKEGDRVASETAARICGHCVYCRSGEYNLCPERLGFGYGIDGAMADFVKVPARCLHWLPNSVSFEKAALTEPCCVAYNAVCVKTHIRPGDSVLVIGPGTIGLLCLMFARIAGANWLCLAGLQKDASRLTMGKLLGANVILDGTDDTAVIRSHGDGLGVDAVIDASGHSAALELALQAVRPGGQITKVGWGPQPLGFSLDLLVKKAARIQGSFSHNFAMWERVIAMFASGRLDPTPLIGRVESLKSWQVCFEEMASGKAVKNVLMPGA